MLMEMVKTSTDTDPKKKKYEESACPRTNLIVGKGSIHCCEAPE